MGFLFVQVNALEALTAGCDQGDQVGRNPPASHL